MNFLLNNEPVLFSRAVPAGFENLHLHGTKILSWVGAAGSLFWQEIVIGDTCLHYLLMRLKATIELQWQPPAAGGILAIGLQGNAVIGLAKQPLSSLQYHFIIGPPVIITATGNLALLFLSHTQETAGTNPQYSKQPFLRNSQQQQLPALTNSCFMPPSMLNAVIQLVQTSYYPEPLPYHANLVNHTWEQAIQALFPGMPGNPLHITALCRIRNLMDSNPCRNITVNELARYGGLNRESLRTGFKALFGKTLHAYQQHNRLTQAQYLLQNTRKPIKEIARLTGYRHLPNFCIAYRKYFGCQPGGERRMG